MEDTSTYSLEEIKENLIKSCLCFNAESFLPYLLSSNVQVRFPNKIRFYTCLKDTLEYAKSNTIGSLELKIEKEPWEKDTEILAFNFYDQVHQYSRINLQVKEKYNSLILNILPF